MTQDMSAGQRAYEEKRAAKAGVSLEKWLHNKAREAERQAQAERQARERSQPAAPGKPTSLWRRLLDRAHRPLKGS